MLAGSLSFEEYAQYGLYAELKWVRQLLATLWMLRLEFGFLISPDLTGEQHVHSYFSTCLVTYALQQSNIIWVYCFGRQKLVPRDGWYVVKPERAVHACVKERMR